MSATATPAIASSLGALVDRYLRVLANERGASAHTMRAYERELRGFAEFAAKRLGADENPARIEHTDIRAYLGTALRSRTFQGIGSTCACRGAQLVQVAGTRGARGTEHGFTRLNTAPPKASAPRAFHRADESRGRFGRTPMQQAGPRATAPFSKCFTDAGSATRNWWA